MRNTRILVVLVAALVLFTGVAAAQGDGGGIGGLLDLIRSIIDLLQGILNLFGG